MSNICDFSRILKTECNLLNFTRNCRIKNLDGFEGDEVDMHGNVFERRESKCCEVLMKHPRKIKGEQVITLQMAQQLKPKILMLYQDNYFVIRVKLNFC